MNKNILLLIIFFTMNAQVMADEKNCEGGVVPVADFSNLENISKHLEWNAASDAEIRNARCIRKNPVTSDEIANWLSVNQSSTNISKKINGISFENETVENLKTFEYLTTALNFLGRPDSAKQKNFSSNCKKVECALKEIFGKDEGLQLMYMHRRYGLNGSHLAQEHSSSWKKAELDTILLSLTDFPEGVLPFQENRTLVHFPRGYVRPGGDGTVANAVIEIFDLWNHESFEQKRYTLTHELGHAIAGVTNIDEHKKWMDMSGWTETTKIVGGKPQKESHVGHDHSIVSKYGQTNPAEDFAESVAAYRYNPKYLQQTNPNKYNLIKEIIFDNVEYNSEDACKNPQRLSKRIQDSMQKRISEWTPSKDDLTNASKKCTDLVIVKLGQDSKVNLQDKEIQTCYEKSLNQQAKEEAMKSIDLGPNKEFLAPMLRNIKLNPTVDARLSKMVDDARVTHGENLKNEFKSALTKHYSFSKNRPNEKFDYIYQAFNKEMGIDPFYKKNEFSKITATISSNINKTGSLRRKLGLDFSDAEISEQIDSMIKY